ncbi:MAG: DUF1801 domain-containing protein [Chitinophagaceae bacterium]
MNPTIDFFFAKEGKWSAEMDEMRAIALDCGLTEELKWGSPCYTWQKKNIVLIHGFKEYCAFLFFKGVLLKDPKGILVQQTANVQSARQIRFTSVQEVVKKRTVLKAYIREAIGLEKDGQQVSFKKSAEFPVAKEFQEKLNKVPGLKAAFQSLTPGRQRGYLLFFSSAKQSSTRLTRIEKYVPHIFQGKGLND